MQGGFPQVCNGVSVFLKIKLIYHINISINTEKALDKIQHPFIEKKNSQQTEYRSNILEYNKGYL